MSYKLYKRHYFLLKNLYMTTFMMKSVQITTTPSPIITLTMHVYDVESTIRIMIHHNSNFDSITGPNITAINEENEINSISKVTILNELIKQCKPILERVQKFNSNIQKRKHETDKLDDEIKLLETREDGKWKKGTTLILVDSFLSGLREHKMSHRRSLNVCYFTDARIADMKHYTVPFLMK